MESSKTAAAAESIASTNETAAIYRQEDNHNRDSEGKHRQLVQLALCAAGLAVSTTDCCSIRLFCRAAGEPGRAEMSGSLHTADC